jgi:hypothetical protein
MQKRVFFGIILGLLALNVALGGYVYVAKSSLATSAPQGAVQQPAPTPIIGRDVPPPNPLRDGGPAQPILELLPIVMLLLTIAVLAWYRSRKPHAQSKDIEQTTS